MKKKAVFAIIALLLLGSCTPRSGSCDIVLTDNHVAVEGAYIVTEEEQDLARELEMNVRDTLFDSESSTNEIRENINKLHRIIEMDPYDYHAYLDRSLLYYMLGELEKSYSDQRTILILDPQSRSFFGFIYETKDKDLEIIKHKLENCLNNEPSNPDYLFEMGVYHFGVGNDTLASEYFEASIALDDTQPLPYYLLAHINFWLGEYEIAYEQSSNAVELNSNNPRYHELKGKVSKLLGDPKYALNYKHMYETCNHPDVCFRAAYEINRYINSIDAINE
jgi:tetratricopeptide (TPR) repeat protein